MSNFALEKIISIKIPMVLCDHTVFCSVHERAGIVLCQILEEEENRKEYLKICKLLGSYAKHLKLLTNYGIWDEYLYKLVFDDYKKKNQKLIDIRYQSYVNNLLVSRLRKTLAGWTETD